MTVKTPRMVVVLFGMLMLVVGITSLHQSRAPRPHPPGSLRALLEGGDEQPPPVKIGQAMTFGGAAVLICSGFIARLFPTPCPHCGGHRTANYCAKCGAKLATKR